MSNPLISVIVPVYNTEKYLSKCLDSLVDQSYSNLEIICINNGSTDQSWDILDIYQKRDSRISVINTANEGVSIARNIGLAHTKGDYILFVDSDDWIDKETCETAIQEILKNNADVVMWSYIREFGRSSLLKKVFTEDRIIFENDEVKQLHRRFIGLTDYELSAPENADALCPVWGKLYKASLIRDHLIEFTDIRKIGTYEDGLFNLEVFRYVKVAVYIDKYFYHYRKDNENSITSEYNQELYRKWQNLYSIMEDYIYDNCLDDSYTVALNNRKSIGILGLGLNIVESDFSHLKKIKKIREIIISHQYRESIKQLDLKYFPIHWKVFYFCAKYKCSFGIFVLLLCIKHLK